MLLLLWLWTVGMILMWYEAQKVLTLRGQTDVSRSYKSVLDLAAAIQTDLTQAGRESTLLTSKELELQIENRFSGGAITVDVPGTPKPYHLFRALGKSTRRNWPWAVAYFLTLICIMLNLWNSYHFVLLGCGFFLALLCATIVGPTNRARLFIFAVAVTVWTLFAMVPYITMHTWLV